jgi:hypothetical protein
MDDKTKEVIFSKGSEVTKAAVDAIVSVFLPVQPFQLASTIKSAYSSIKEQLFSEKLAAFFSKSETVTEDERDKFLALLNKDQEEFFKRLFVVIDRLDSVEKAAIIGKLFNALVKRDLDVDSFLELTSAIEASYIKDLNYFINEYSTKTSRKNNPAFSNEDLPLRKLSSLGFVNHHTSSVGALPISHFDITTLGDLLVKYGK